MGKKKRRPCTYASPSLRKQVHGVGYGQFSQHLVLIAPENSNSEVMSFWYILYQSLKVTGFKGLFAGTCHLCPFLEAGQGELQTGSSLLHSYVIPGHKREVDSKAKGLSSDPSSATFQLCDFGQANLSWPVPLSVKWG